MLNTYGMIVAAFSVMDKGNRVRFFEETFLIANISLKEVFGMPFLILSGTDVDVLGRKLWWRTYTTKKALPTTRHVKLVGKKKFVAVTLNLEYETYIVHVTSLSSTLPVALDIHLSQRFQIFGLITKKTLTKVSAKYSDDANNFFPDLASELPKHTGINNYAIKLVNSQQPFYKLIYSLELVEL